MRSFTVVAFLSLSAAAQVVPGRYIVELTEPPAAATAARLHAARPSARAAELAAAPEVEAARARIGALQARLGRQIAARGARVRGGVDTALNALFVECTPEQAAQIAALPDVARVSPDRMYHARLDRVLTLSNVPDAFLRVGVDKAGAGIRVAILDSGIDTGHPGFKDDSLTPPDGFPKANSEANLALLTRKVIAVRSYEDLNGEGYGTDARDKNGHGTNAACAAACILHETRIGHIAGAAPKAFLGAYKVLGDNGGGSNAAIIKGIDDAMKDGMDVLNLSLGSDIAGDPATDDQVKALNNAADAGHIIAAAAGNAGPDENTINSPGTAEKVITVGSSSSDRAFEGSTPKPIDPNRLSDFSSRGPNPGTALKPDMTAVGDNFYTAQTTLKDPNVFYTITQGTSFATPTVAGAAATLKAARPGLTSAQYRSLLINSSSQITLADGKPAPIRHQGAGRLDLLAALDMPVAATPTSFKFGAAGEVADLTRFLNLANLLEEPLEIEIAVRAYDDKRAPTLEGEAKRTVAAKEAVALSFKFAGDTLVGEYQGVILVRNNKNDRIARIPYWYAVRSSVPKAIALLEAKQSGPAGGTVDFAARVLDAAGVEIPGAPLAINTATPGAEVVAIEPDSDKPGTINFRLKLGPGENVFVFSAGEVTRNVVIEGQ
jgi:subtilisin family serine protease